MRDAGDDLVCDISSLCISCQVHPVLAPEFRLPSLLAWAYAYILQGLSPDPEQNI
jgi:hypothetical protein